METGDEIEYLTNKFIEYKKNNGHETNAIENRVISLKQLIELRKMYADKLTNDPDNENNVKLYNYVNDKIKFLIKI
jgi:hypothetical protein